MPTSTWKSVERKLARMFGVERNQDTHGDDFHTATIAVEVKHRTKLPKIVTDALTQVAGARPDRIPVAIFHLKGQRVDDSLCVMRTADFLSFYQEAGRWVATLYTNSPCGRKQEADND